MRSIVSKSLILLVVISAIILSIIVHKFERKKIQKAFSSHSHVMFKEGNTEVMLNFEATLELKPSGSYSFTLLEKNGGYGFDSAGTYILKGNYLSLFPSYSKRISMRERKDISLMSDLIASRGMHSIENIKISNISSKYTSFSFPRFTLVMKPILY